MCVSFNFIDDNLFSVRIVNYDIASALIRRNQSEEDEAYAAFSEDDDDITGNQLITEIEDELNV